MVLSIVLLVMMNLLRNALPKSSFLYSYQNYAMYDCTWDSLGPQLQEQIIAFRDREFGGLKSDEQDAGSDIDQYDPLYRHVMVICTETDSLASYYRVGLISELYEKHGGDAFYLTSLYNVSDKFFTENPGAGELGRLILDQKQTNTQFLFPLIWKSLNLFAQKHGLKKFFGMVTIDPAFQKRSIDAMVNFMRTTAPDTKNQQLVVPHYPYETDADAFLAESMTDLQDYVKEAEKGERPVSVMYRTYLTYAHCQFVAAGYDPDFSNAVDIIIMGDPFTETLERVIRKFQ